MNKSTKTTKNNIALEAAGCSFTVAGVTFVLLPATNNVSHALGLLLLKVKFESLLLKILCACILSIPACVVAAAFAAATSILLQRFIRLEWLVSTVSIGAAIIIGSAVALLLF